MRWEDMRRSENVRDRRGMAVGGGIGIGGILIALVVSWLTGINPLALLGVVESVQGPSSVQQKAPPPPSGDRQADFVARVLGDTEDVWNRIFQASKASYREPKLSIFRGSVRSACGMATEAVGPFYCPADQEVYLDLSFFDDLESKFGAPGEFARAYVVAHEVGHHVQTLLGISEKVQRTGARLSERDRNQLSVMQELQADCFAGVWGHYAAQRKLIDTRDMEQGLRAAAAIGDDRLTRGRVTPDAFTHGTSQQRMTWFRRGLETGDVNQCDTFSAAR
jgi:predicted metalloprotease